jgi:hypothetical protein
MPTLERTVAPRVGLNLRTIQRHCAELERPHCAGQLKNLDEQNLHLRQKTLTKCNNRVVIGMLIAGDEVKRHRIIGLTLRSLRVVGFRARAAVGSHPLRDRSSPSITSTTKRARYLWGSNSSNDGGSKYPGSRLIGRRLFIAPTNIPRTYMIIVRFCRLSPTGC